MWKACLSGRPYALQSVRSCGPQGLVVRARADISSSRQAAAAAVKLDDGGFKELRPSGKQQWRVMDGNEAAAYCAYAMSDISFIYPISPATSMGEHMDKWASQGKKNILGQTVDVNMMQSEGGAAGALHGAAAAGSMTSTFTASQGLLLMIPNMYLLAGELVPTVFHVSARTISKHALSIFNDHSDVMATRQTGFSMLASSSVQEVMDMGVVAHVASLKSRIPMMHFFDGYRTSAEMSKIQTIPHEDITQLFPEDKLRENLHDYALNPYHPIIRGTGQRPDIFFQNSVAANKYYEACPDIIAETLRDLAVLTGREYKLFDYFGSPTADRVAVCIGSGAQTLKETVNYMNDVEGANVGLINVHLYRPWSTKHFMDVLPDTVKKIAVLDRTREDGASGMPLFLDVNVAMAESNRHALVTGGQFGLASKEFTPAMGKAVFENLNAEKPMQKYVIGINDDVTHTSLSYGKNIPTVPKGTTQCIFWGLGGDGVVGANKSAIKTIGDNTTLKAQGHFVYDSHKMDGVTISHLRFGPEEITSEYEIMSDASYMACSHPSYVNKYEMFGPLMPGGIFVLNSPWTTMEEMEKRLPASFKRSMAEKDLQFYNIDATSLAQRVGLGKRLNMVLQSVFYGLSGVLPPDEAMDLLKKSIAQQYSHKGPKVIAANINAVDAAMQELQKIEYNREAWLQGGTAGEEKSEGYRPEFVSNIMDPVLALKGDDLPVSAFEPGGYQPIGTSTYEKRGIAPNIPVWKPDNCTQCNYCALVCPHAVIRPFLLDKMQTKAAPSGFESRKSKGGAEVAGTNYTIQVSPFDCTGCEVCVESCPDDALYMAPFNDVAEEHVPHWDYAISLPEVTEVGDKYSVKGSQFERPLMEFSGACAGCGETPYLKLATQLYGSRMVIANASGCSSVWGGTSTTIPFTTNEEGNGPAWGRSLFEDNAEYGFGMMLATKQRRQKVFDNIKSIMADFNHNLPPGMAYAFKYWIENHENHEKCDKASKEIEQLLNQMVTNEGGNVQALDPRLREIYRHKDMLRTQSHWLVGGDGWAYDIGYGGLDHVMSRNENVNILVLDTEMYSNTGGQVSKATQLSTVTKYASHGKTQIKKDLGLAAMQYENIYVASVAMGANYNQCVQAFKEAESHEGTSLIIAYSPCIDWGIDMKDMMHEQKDAVNSGYWTLYRFDPSRKKTGKTPFQLDSKKLRTELSEYLGNQNRFEQLRRNEAAVAASLQTNLNEEVKSKHQKLQRMAMDDYEMLEHLKDKLGEATESDKVVVLYGSETGNAASLAQVFSNELLRRGIRAKCLAMDDFDVDDLPKQTKVFVLAATCGQGEFPGNCKEFWNEIQNPDLPSDFLKDVDFTVFGLGDSSYVFYNDVAKKLDSRFSELGGKCVMSMGLGDDKDDDRYETVWNEWMPELWNNLGTDPPSAELLPPSYNVAIDTSSQQVPAFLHHGSKFLPMTENTVLTPPEYTRDIRHYEFDLAGTGISYSVGDCLGIYPHNDPEEVGNFLADLKMSEDTVINLEDLQDRKESLPPAVTAKQLFTEVLDVFGKPPRRFYETLQMCATDENEKSELEHLQSKEGKEDFKKLLEETPHFFDLMTMFPSTKEQLSLEHLIDHIPQIKPRLYSIGSASEMVGEKVQLAIVVEDWETPSGKYRAGACTRYLKGLSQPGESFDMVTGKMSAAGINWPDSHAAPCLMVALGTGIAPMRAMIQDREMARLRGDPCGEMALLYGARYKASEYTYGDEFEEYHNNGNGVLTNHINAFSRDQEKKIYVQHRLHENPEMVYDYLFKKQGFFYLCGPAGNVPPSVRAAIRDAFVKCGDGDFTPESAEKYITDMQINGRYNIEAW